MTRVRFKTTASLDNPETRKSWAKLLSNLVEISSRGDGLPFMPNEGKDDYWSLDSANNWRFFVVDDSHFELGYRYGIEPILAVIPWLQYRFKVSLVPDAHFSGIYKDGLDTVYQSKGVRYVLRMFDGPGSVQVPTWVCDSKLGG